MEKEIFKELENMLIDTTLQNGLLRFVENKNNSSIYYANNLICSINITSKSKYMSFDVKHISLFADDFETKQVKSDASHFRFLFSSLDDIKRMKDNFIIILQSITTASTFDICSRYEQCSDERRCVHPDQVHALECSYRRKLQDGVIFYGKNRNV